MTNYKIPNRIKIYQHQLAQDAFEWLYSTNDNYELMNENLLQTNDFQTNLRQAIYKEIAKLRSKVTLADVNTDCYNSRV